MEFWREEQLFVGVSWVGWVDGYGTHRLMEWMMGARLGVVVGGGRRMFGRYIVFWEIWRAASSFC